MIRSRTVNKIHDLYTQGKSIQDIAIELGIARNTVRKYLRHPELAAMPHPRPNRRSKLDPFKEQVRRWITEDHCYNCEAMLPRLLEMGYTGSLWNCATHAATRCGSRSRQSGAGLRDGEAPAPLTRTG